MYKIQSHATNGNDNYDSDTQSLYRPLSVMFVVFQITIHRFVPGVGFEPTNPFGSRILSPLRKPFRHPGIRMPL